MMEHDMIVEWDGPHGHHYRGEVIAWLAIDNMAHALVKTPEGKIIPAQVYKIKVVEDKKDD